ncbi:MAG: hypothetical protein EPO35_01230 [Acidobacteria bacterium]|nr:MAG: hypothetical protein EPO35_01230 [Acidobacteriota bacterium]
MNTPRFFKRAVAGAALALAISSGAPLGAAQIVEEGYVYHRGVVRVLQDYRLGPTDAVREATIIYGNVQIDGQVDWDLRVVFGELHLTKTAIVRGSVFVTAGNVTIDDGATIRRDLVVVGGTTTAPPTFAPGGEHVVLGNQWLGDTMRGVMPWLTRGLLWGRIIVPDIQWVWSVLFVFLILTLAINTLLHEPVGAFAATLSARPFSAFATGLLVLLLAGPVCALLAATVIGIAIIPFFLCAIVLAWITGKVGVLRWIGRTIFTRGAEPETRLQAIRSVSVGFLAISLLYMVPVVGIVTWAMIGVFGLGAATQHFLSGLRRERPPKPPKAPKAPAPAPTPGGEPVFAAAVPPESPMDYRHAAPEPPPPPPPPPTFAPGDLRAFPHAAFLDRLAALAIDLILIGVLTSIMVSSRRTFDDEPYFPMLFFAYCALFWAWQGTTIGGIVCNLRMVKADGKRLEFVDAFVRALGGVLSVAALGIGFLWILRDPQQQAWHDKIAGTIVVKVPRGTPLE